MENPINRPGDVALIVDEKPVNLRLTLGALAELEQRLNVPNIASLATRIASPAAADILVMLQVLSKAGGTPLDPSTAPVNISEMMQAIASVFKKALAAQNEDEKKNIELSGG